MFLITVLTYSVPEVHNGYIYPTYTLVIGNIIAIGPVILFFLIAIAQVFRQRGSFIKVKPKYFVCLSSRFFTSKRYIIW